MELTIRRLDPTNDEALYHIAFGWLEDAPKWRRETEAVFGTLDREQYLDNRLVPNRVDVGVFTGPEFVALITLMLIDVGIYEAHFESTPDCPRDVIVRAAQMVAHQMFTDYGMQAVYTWVPRYNRPVAAINKAIGFRRDGVNMLHGTCKGKLIDWVRYSLPNPYTEMI